MEAGSSAGLSGLHSVEGGLRSALSSLTAQK
jgi:hypothetical protein